MTDTLVRPSRRTLVRSAAWSVPVVSLAAMAPAFASSSSARLTGGPAVKWGGQGPKHVEWDLQLITLAAVKSISIAFTYYPNGGGGTATFTALKVYTFSPTVDNNWVVPAIPAGGSNSATVSYGPPNGPIAANTTTEIHTDFTGTDNSTGTVTAIATVTYVSGTTETLPIVTVAWSQGSPHTHATP